MLSLSPPNYLYAITDCHHFSGDALAEKTLQILKGGCRLVQYRDKSTNTQKRLAEATQLKELCRDFKAKLVINDDIDLASQIGADGVHLGQSDGDIKYARQRLGPNAIIGVTCHSSLTLAANALDDSANYIAFGRFFASTTKPNATAAPMELLTQARNRWPNVVIVAIGGINQNNATQVISHGASYTAVCEGIYHAASTVKYSQSFSLNLNQNAGSVL
ncbi:thiamine phosphate synthase [Gilvimarinus chinensis]|uniref:thiamine phosphate synthase n=1 Tax=Gilvimarinus chinensis TaxID=396005 RepID=UPI0003632941|nr:thiamine phosphate synthase [Gilvimarinus chinensis]